MINYTLIFKNGDHYWIKAEDYAHAYWKAEEYEIDYDTKLDVIYED